MYLLSSPLSSKLSFDHDAIIKKELSILYLEVYDIYPYMHIAWAYKSS